MKGTAPVRIEALGYKASGEGYEAPENYDRGNYSIQIGSFKDQQNAIRLSGEMKKLHGYSEVKSALVNGEQFYRVQAGVFTSLRAAEEAEERFAGQGYPGSFAVALD